MSIQDKASEITPEHIMLVILLIMGTVFFVRPITEEYPEAASQFPQFTSAVVIVGSLLLLVRNYLPGALQTFVAESVSITDSSGTTDQYTNTSDEDDDGTDSTESTEPTADTGPRTIGQQYGIEINDTAFMLGLSIAYLAIGYAVGLLYVTPLFVLAYTSWFRVRWYIGLGLAILSTLVILGFIEFLLLPFDQGAYLTLWEV
jgi:hypothetical protein